MHVHENFASGSADSQESVVTHYEGAMRSKVLGQSDALLGVKREAFPFVISNVFIEHSSVLLQKLQVTGKGAESQSSGRM